MKEALAGDRGVCVMTCGQATDGKCVRDECIRIFNEQCEKKTKYNIKDAFMTAIMEKSVTYATFALVSVAAYYAIRLA